MMSKPVEEKIVAVICYKKRSTPRYYYQSKVLRYYTPYIAYFRLLPTPENLKKAVDHLKAVIQGKRRKGEELVVFSIRGVDAVLNYAKSFDAEIQYFEQQLKKIKAVEKVPVIIFPDRYSAMRHFIYSITYATVRSISKVERIREIVDGLNVNIIEPFFNTAILRYRELVSNSDPKWYWKVLRIGRAFKVMYLIDKA